MRCFFLDHKFVVVVECLCQNYFVCIGLKSLDLFFLASVCWDLKFSISIAEKKICKHKFEARRCVELMLEQKQHHHIAQHLVNMHSHNQFRMFYIMKRYKKFHSHLMLLHWALSFLSIINSDCLDLKGSLYTPKSIISFGNLDHIWSVCEKTFFLSNTRTNLHNTRNPHLTIVSWETWSLGASWSSAMTFSLKFKFMLTENFFVKPQP